MYSQTSTLRQGRCCHPANTKKTEYDIFFKFIPATCIPGAFLAQNCVCGPDPAVRSWYQSLDHLANAEGGLAAPSLGTVRLWPRFSVLWASVRPRPTFVYVYGMGRSPPDFYSRWEITLVS